MKFEIVIADNMTAAEIKAVITDLTGMGLSVSVKNELDIIHVWGFKNNSTNIPVVLGDFLTVLKNNKVKTDEIKINRAES